MEQLINYESFEQSAKVNDFFIVTNPLHTIAHEQLILNYPKEDFFKEQIGIDTKQYKFCVHNLVENDVYSKTSINQPNTLWSKLICELLSNKYTQTLSSLINIDLNEKKRSIGLYKFKSNMYVSKHLDKERKILTQLFYFNNTWQSNYGGEFNIYNHEDSRPLISIPPIALYSIVIIRTTNSWHSVCPINTEQFTRNTLQVEYWL